MSNTINFYTWKMKLARSPVLHNSQVFDYFSSFTYFICEWFLINIIEYDGKKNVWLIQ